MTTPTSADLQQLRDRVRAAYALADSASSRSALEFLRRVVIDSRPRPRRFSDVARPWQKALSARILPAVESLVGVRDNYSGPRSFWVTLPRGHDKTGLIGRVCNWALAYTRSHVNCLAAAKDRDQANLLLESMFAEANLNPWLKRRLTFKNYRVDGQKGSILKAVSSDAKGSFGFRGDLLVFDELTHWESRELWDAIVSGVEKRPGRVLLVITNAGLKGSWQEEMLHAAISDPGEWFVYQAPGRLETWMDDGRLDRLAKLLPPAVARRVLFNEWVDPGEEAGLVTRSEVAACASLGRELQLVYRERSASEDFLHIAAVDYGPVKDRTVCVVLHQRNDGVVVVDRMDVMQGCRSAPVTIEAVERWVDEVRKSFRIAALVVDPYQMEGTIQRYTGVLPVEKFEARGGKSNYALAANLRALIVNRQVAWYEGCGGIPLKGRMHTLDDELVELLVRQMSYGFRIDHTSGKHDDRAVALGMAALHAVQRGRKFSLPEDLSLYF